MKLDPDTLTVTFKSAEELRTFHLHLTGLVREAIGEASRSSSSPDEAAASSRELFQRYPTVLRALNVLRKAIPREIQG